MVDSTKLVITINGNAKDFLDEIDKVKKETASLEKVLTETAKVSAVAFAGFAAAIASVTRAFADYEKALVGVGKTTNIEERRLRAFGREFQRLSSEIPISTNELLGIAQAAGQLGVEGEENLLKFTETVAKLGVSTDLTGEQAATALTRILNVTGESIDSIDVLGSVIVELGNNFAATESEIVRVATEVSRSTAVFDVSSTQAAALATALRSVGVQAQLGGSAVGRGFRAIDAAIREGGQSIERLSQITGIAGEDLRRTFEEDSVSVFQAFIEGLGEIEEAGGDVTSALAAFGLQGDEILKVLPVLATNSELLGRALNTAAQETQEVTALNEEAAKAFNTLAAEGQRLSNNFENLQTNIGEQLAPQITELLQTINELLTSINEADEETISLIASFIKWGTIITGVIASITSAALAFLKLRAVFVGGGRIITSVLSGISTSIGGISISFAEIAATARTALGGLASRLTGILSLATLTGDAVKDTFDPATASIEEVENRLSSLEVQLESINNLDITPTPEQTAFKEDLEQQIALLRELRTEREQTNAALAADFEQGSGVLLRPETDLTGLDGDLGLPQQQIPLAPDGESTAGDAQTESIKKNAAEQQDILDKATQQRLDAARRANADLLEIQQERLNGATEEELAALQRRQAIEEEFAQAQNIQNQQERELAIANIRLRNEQELQLLQELESRKQEFNQTAREEQEALNEELRALDVEQQEALAQEDLDILQSSIDSQAEAERKAATERLQRQIRERNQFKQDEINFGTEIANLKKFFNKQEVQGVRSTTQDLAQLSRSRNSTLKGIGKAAARVNAAIATAEGSIKAYASLAGIPVVGPALGAAAAGALIAFGLEQQAQISAAQQGGFVPPSGFGSGINAGSRDRVPTLLEAGELIVPRAIAPNFIQAAGIPDTQAGEAVGDVSEGEGTPMIMIDLSDRAGETITLEQREGRSLGLIGAN